MKISDLIKELEKIKTEHGDLKVVYYTLSHSFSPEVTVKGKGEGRHVVLNP